MNRLLLGMLALCVATPAAAGEVFGGLYVHDVDTPLSLSGVEGGADIQLGWRSGRIGRTPLQPYLFAAANTAGATHYGAVGLSAKFGDRVFIRPGLGLAIHTGSSADVTHRDHDHVDFGSRLLFEPELGIGFRINDRATVEASWVHLSHGRLFGGQNPGIDNVGARLSWKLGR